MDIKEHWPTLVFFFTVFQKQLWVNAKGVYFGLNLPNHILSIIVLEIGVLTFIDSLLVIKNQKNNRKCLDLNQMSSFSVPKGRCLIKKPFFWSAKHHAFLSNIYFFLYFFHCHDQSIHVSFLFFLFVHQSFHFAPRNVPSKRDKKSWQS